MAGGLPGMVAGVALSSSVRRWRARATRGLSGRYRPATVTPPRRDQSPGRPPPVKGPLRRYAPL